MLYIALSLLCTLCVTVANVIYIVKHDYIKDLVSVKSIKCSNGVIINDSIPFSRSKVRIGDNLVYNEGWIERKSYLRKLWVKCGLLCCLLIAYCIVDLIIIIVRRDSKWIIPLLLIMLKLSCIWMIAGVEFLYNNIIVNECEKINNVVNSVKMDDGNITYETGTNGTGTLYTLGRYTMCSTADIYNRLARNLRMLLIIIICAFEVFGIMSVIILAII